MDSGTLLEASTPKDMDGAEVSSRRIPGEGELQEAAREVPEGETSDAGHMGEQTPMDTDDGGHIQFVPQPNTVPETHMAPESGQTPLAKEGGVPIPPVTSVHPEVPDICWKRCE